ncbi:MAG: tetratricopeptide repeat protein [Polyangiaceae bacterium]|nr:tetratricopeptide repeat protein [Polyangiaceae bacterium]
MVHRPALIGLLACALWLSASALACAGQAPLHPKAVVLNEAGVAALAAGDLTTAEARFALALEFHPRFVDALVNLALVELEQGNFALAKRTLDEAVAINRHIAQPHHGLGLLAERESRWPDAATHYRAALEVDPSFSPARANLARLYFEAGMLDDAREQYLRLIQVAPVDPVGYAGLAECLSRLGRDQEASRVLREAELTLGDAPELRIYHARQAMRDGEPATARALLEPLRNARGPIAREAWAWTGVAFLMEHRIELAVRSAEHALSFDRNHALATYVLAMALAERGDPAAERWLERAKRLAPDSSVLSEAMVRVAATAALRGEN